MNDICPFFGINMSSNSLFVESHHPIWWYLFA